MFSASHYIRCCSCQPSSEAGSQMTPPLRIAPSASGAELHAASAAPYIRPYMWRREHAKLQGCSAYSAGCQARCNKRHLFHGAAGLVASCLLAGDPISLTATAVHAIQNFRGCLAGARACMRPQHAVMHARRINGLPQVLWLLFLHIPWLGLPGAMCPVVVCAGMHGWSF